MGKCISLKSVNIATAVFKCERVQFVTQKNLISYVKGERFHGKAGINV